jgi:hypothetical protein
MDFYTDYIYFLNKVTIANSKIPERTLGFLIPEVLVFKFGIIHCVYNVNKDGVIQCMNNKNL